MDLKENKKAVIYARLSGIEEDGEAKSIENQINALTEYAKNNDLQIINVYYDYGITGTHMNRPGLINLFTDMEKDLFNCILVKDLSRFSRNYLEAGKYIELIFPYKNIRFISVSDNYDSAIPNDESIVIRNFLNTMYAKDIKKKIHKSLKNRVTTKDLISIPKYGFKYNENKELIIDEQAANIVRYIFKLCLDGKKPQEIADTLEQEKIYYPSYYKKHILGIKPNRLGNKKENPYKWDKTSINKMLHDYEYCGYAVNITGKSRVKDINSKIMIKNARQQIIDEETFNLVPKKFVERKTQDEFLITYPSIFKCKACNLSLSHSKAKEGNGKLFCPKCKKKYNTDGLVEVTYLYAKEVLEKALHSPKEFLMLFKNKIKNEDTDNLIIQRKKLNKAIKKIFEDKITLKITNELYQQKIKEYNNKLTIIEKKLALSKQSKYNEEILIAKYEQLINILIEEYSNKSDLINKIISKVYVDIVDNKVATEIEIKMFEGVNFKIYKNISVN